MSNPSSPENNYDPAGSTQMFRAFVDEQPQQRAAETSSGSRTGLIVGVVAVVIVLVAVAWLAFK
jgi:hypothetical protein